MPRTLKSINCQEKTSQNQTKPNYTKLNLTRKESYEDEAENFDGGCKEDNFTP